jgi:hypothetical protein
MRWRQLLRLSASWSDYEDLRVVPAQPLLWLQPDSSPRALLLTQKEPVFRRIAPELAKRSVAVCLVPYPTPGPKTFEAVGRWSRAFQAPPYWFGDLDPIGLMAFAVLRSEAGEPGRPPRRTRLSYIGIDDRWLQACRREVSSDTRALDSQLIPMGRHERQHFDFLAETVPDLRALVGERSYDVLASGRKLEVEGLMTISPRLLRSTPRMLASRMAGSAPRRR